MTRSLLTSFIFSDAANLGLKAEGKITKTLLKIKILVLCDKCCKNKISLAFDEIKRCWVVVIRIKKVVSKPLKQNVKA